MNRDHSWAILPATRCLFNKNKVTLDEVSNQWNEGTILVCTTEKNKLVFIFSSGSIGRNVGDFNSAHHDQTGARLGEFKIVDVVTYNKFPGNKLNIFATKLFDENTKAPLFVFK